MVFNKVSQRRKFRRLLSLQLTKCLRGMETPDKNFWVDVFDALMYHTSKKKKITTPVKKTEGWNAGQELAKAIYLRSLDEEDLLSLRVGYNRKRKQEDLWSTNNVRYQERVRPEGYQDSDSC